MNSKPFFLIVIVLLFFPTNNLRASAPIVGYGSTGTALSPTDRAIFKSGFELGVKAALKVKLPENWLLMLDSPEQGELSPKAVGQKLVDSGISLLVGFPTSHEALMMGELSRKIIF